VLGDWFFNMEFLLQADIGVLPEPLALYHHRDQGDSRSGLYANSVIGGVSKHEEFTSIARNEFLRRHANNSNAALSVVFGYIANDMRGRLDRIHDNVHYDRIDLYWTIGQINRFLAEKKWMFWKNYLLPSAIGPNVNWEEVLMVLRKVKINIPPPSDFDENGYLINNPDVKKSAKEGGIPSGYMHYLLYGRTEGRQRPIRS
jgi:hypothetical protein